MVSPEVAGSRRLQDLTATPPFQLEEATDALLPTAEERALGEPSPQGSSTPLPRLPDPRMLCLGLRCHHEATGEKEVK